MAEEITIRTEPFGPDQRALDRVQRALVRHPDLKGHLPRGRHRLLAFELTEPARKLARPKAPDRFEATFFDYRANESVLVSGTLSRLDRLEVERSSLQPLPSAEEIEAAMALVADSEEFGPALREGRLETYAAMPGIVEDEQPDGTVERTLAVGLLPREGGRRLRHEIVGVNLIRGTLARYADGAPPTARADGGICGTPVSAGQPTTGKGLAGQVWVSVFLGQTRLWRFLAVRPSASSGTWGSGVELRYVDYRNRRVLYRAHVPILNVLYDGNACGPYRDWQYQEGMLQAAGSNVAPGFVLASSPAKTILETGSDTGTFLGTAIYVDGLEVVLVCEMQAGWYRYVSEWRLHADGTIRPRFGFDATSSSCVCVTHHHHVYWRLDFDIETPGNNRVMEFNDPAIVAGSNWHQKTWEIMRYRSSAHKRRWKVENQGSGRGYEIRPGAHDGTAAGDAYARGDLWFLRYRGTEIDDAPIIGTEIQIDKYRNGESLAGQDVVVWYGGHFTHDVTGPEPPSHYVGPELRAVNW